MRRDITAKSPWIDSKLAVQKDLVETSGQSAALIRAASASYRCKSVPVSSQLGLDYAHGRLTQEGLFQVANPFLVRFKTSLYLFKSDMQVVVQK